MSFYHVTVMLLHRCTCNELGRCGGWGREANKERGVSPEECRERLGGQRSGSCGTAGEGNEAAEEHLLSAEISRGRSFHGGANWLLGPHQTLHHYNASAVPSVTSSN